MDRIFLCLYANALVLRFLDTFKEFPPRAEPASFTISAAVEKMKRAMESAGG
jgi:arylsulfatase